MKITKLTEHTIKAEIKNKGTFSIDISGSSMILSRFFNFFRNLAIELKMSVNDKDFIELIEEEDIFEIYDMAHKEYKKGRKGNIFEEAEGAWETEITENMVKGQKVRGITEEDYDFIMTIKGKVSPRWLRQNTFKYITIKDIEKKLYMGKALDAKDHPILPLEENLDGVTIN